MRNICSISDHYNLQKCSNTALQHAKAQKQQRKNWEVKLEVKLRKCAFEEKILKWRWKGEKWSWRNTSLEKIVKTPKTPKNEKSSCKVGQKTQRFRSEVTSHLHPPPPFTGEAAVQTPWVLKDRWLPKHLWQISIFEDFCAPLRGNKPNNVFFVEPSFLCRFKNLNSSHRGIDTKCNRENSSFMQNLLILSFFWSFISEQFSP